MWAFVYKSLWPSTGGYVRRIPAGKEVKIATMVSGPKTCWLIDWLFTVYIPVQNLYWYETSEQSLFVFWLMSLIVRVVSTTRPFVGQTLLSILCSTMSCIYWNYNMFDAIIFMIMWNIKAEFLKL